MERQLIGFAKPSSASWTKRKSQKRRVEKGVYVFYFWVDEEVSLKKKKKEVSGNSRQA